MDYKIKYEDICNKDLEIINDEIEYILNDYFKNFIDFVWFTYKNDNFDFGEFINFIANKYKSNDLVDIREAFIKYLIEAYEC